MTKLTELPDCTRKQATALESAGIKTVEVLREQTRTVKGRLGVARQTDLPLQYVSKLSRHADLFRVGGLSTIGVQLLNAIQVHTVADLTSLSGDAGYWRAMLVDANNQHRISRKVPSLNKVKGWIEHANKLEIELQ